MPARAFTASGSDVPFAVASPAPAYAFYPTPQAMGECIGAEEYRRALEHSNAAARPLSLYVHLPFCQQACFHCTRRPVTTSDTRLTEAYLTRLDREMVLTSRHLDARREVRSLQWGGGTPTFLTLDQMSDLIDRLDARFRLAGDRDREYLIEIDPREADVFTLRHLEALGFNRLSLEVLDLDDEVQQAINRQQGRGLTEQLLDEADRLGFNSVNLNLILGLPRQTRDGFAATLEQVIAMAPSRLSLFHYHHHPERFPRQRQIRPADLPTPQEVQGMLQAAIEMLAAAGYVHLGHDRFARGDDRLARALGVGGERHDLVGLGVMAVSRLEDLHVRNPLRLEAYEDALDRGELPTAVGHRLSLEDRLRSAAIERLMRDLPLDLAALGEAFGLDAEAHLAEPLARLALAEPQGLIVRQGPQWRATPTGRLMIRQLAAAFDAYPAAP
ncbi:oxygen-independent coproporphyrinogen III oxidase [Halomonas urmiana]|uniref:Coproporphyrinogen-III oxidase n=1 Tax=Halomonas urmiana TaxID=490901 RepID=A0A5R8MGZ3_9GAMM|nr:oxygen-independent coproporphyrinogen III oxidase [Halomonas urmiana]TLF50473.1 oxygen-independent coproporphyrinogen III oxidase [Halomonas urmiana]